jgi:hypothetical protein
MVSVVFRYPNGDESKPFNLTLEQLQAIKIANEIFVEDEGNAFDSMTYNVEFKQMNIWLKEL